MKKRRIISGLVAAAVAIGSAALPELPGIYGGMTIAASADVTDSGDLENGLSWSLEDTGVLTISGTGAMPDYGGTSGAVVPWSSHISSILGIVIEDGVTNVSDGAFAGCTNAVSVSLGSSVKTIGKSAFSGCRGLTSVTLPDSVTEIGNSAFYSCSGLSSVKLSSALTLISQHAFEMCSGLTTLTVPASTQTVEAYAFKDCTGITNLNIEDGVKELGEEAFAGCTSLQTVMMGSSVKTIGRGIFKNCTALTTATLSDGLTSVSEDAFSGCTSLKTAVLPASLTSISRNAFLDCAALTKISLPSTVRTIETQAFSGTGLTSAEIPEGVKRMTFEVFNGCADLETIKLPKTINTIEESILAYCPKLTEIQFAGSETQWGKIDFNELEGETKTYGTQKAYMGVSESVVIRFLDTTPIAPNTGGSISASSTNLSPGQEFKLTITVPAIAKSAENASVTVKFDADSFSVVSWYSDSADLTALKAAIPNAAVSSGADYLSLDAENDSQAIDLSSGLTLTATMKVSPGASVGTHEFSLEKSSFTYTIADTTTTAELWAPLSKDTTVNVSVSSTVISGVITDFDLVGGTAAVELINSGGTAVQTMTTTDGEYIFENVSAGETYTVRITMPGCAPHEFTVSSGSAPAAEKIRKYGDLTGNGEVDEYDAADILRYLVGVNSCIKGADGKTDEYLLKVAKVLKKPELSAKDATQILRKVAKMSSVFDNMQ